MFSNLLGMGDAVSVTNFGFSALAKSSQTGMNDLTFEDPLPNSGVLKAEPGDGVCSEWPWGINSPDGAPAGLRIRAVRRR